METCFTCKKAISKELLKGDDLKDDESRKFCPTCQQFRIDCSLCKRGYICADYLLNNDEYFYNTYFDGGW